MLTGGPGGNTNKQSQETMSASAGPGQTHLRLERGGILLAPRPRPRRALSVLNLRPAGGGGAE